MNMGKEKIEEKDVRLLRYAVEQAFDGAMRDGALALFRRVPGRIRFLPRGSLRNRKRMMRIFRSREDGMHLRGDSVREIPFMLFLGLLFAVTVGWWVFLTLTVSVVFGNVAAAVFAVCSALSVTVGYGLVCASDSRE